MSINQPGPEPALILRAVTGSNNIVIDDAWFTDDASKSLSDGQTIVFTAAGDGPTNDFGVNVVYYVVNSTENSGVYQWNLSLCGNDLLIENNNGEIVKSSDILPANCNTVYSRSTELESEKTWMSLILQKQKVF